MATPPAEPTPTPTPTPTEPALVAPSEEEALRRDAEAALADLYERLIDAERLLVEAGERAVALQGDAVVLAAERDQLVARLEALEGALAQGRAEHEADVAALNARVAEEVHQRIAAERHAQALESTKVFRYLRLPRRLYAALKG